MPLVVKSVSVFRDVSVLVFECLFDLFLCLLLKVLCLVTEMGVVYRHVSPGARRGLKRAPAPLALEVPAVVSCPVVVWKHT